ncbi:hypothetical protein MPL1_07473 [Methylophaga lonarensis MPL]|uniref:Succinylglutamate desuccinylase n=1 Tax=Methylophaga lonarensis MPL TaxID=1286106 RepID=M7P0H1_9GAMM|nr:DUF1826 domain-containing protein [Methylophaga lonarensis]EMR12971.1 hypothetical protein MPL1_07473 [Methylophaga lonarensis MPL]
MLAENQPYSPISVFADEPMVMTRIYDAEVNLAVWNRSLARQVVDYAELLCQQSVALQLRSIVEPASTTQHLIDGLPDKTGRLDFVKDVAGLVEMFADLFELERVGIRLSIIDNTMCPRFHTDHLPCRLVTSYAGAATQWLPEATVDRSKLGAGAAGLPDHLSGIYCDPAMIQQLNTGDVALLKGDGWHGNSGYGIVHRSPAINIDEKRLLLTLDFAE